jgi:phenylalanyl-tRNA synthetase beta chain
MKFTYNWLKDFVDIKLKPEALAQRLTMAGLEVKGIEEKQGDFVFEAEITSNRPDWLSVIGVAREVAAITGARLKTQKAKAGRKNLKKEKSSLKIEIEDKKDCPLYTAKIICGLKVAASPKWLSERLEAIGCRSINNLVDITNYVMFTWGEPLHAFDLDSRAPGEKGREDPDYRRDSA